MVEEDLADAGDLQDEVEDLRDEEDGEEEVVVVVEEEAEGSVVRRDQENGEMIIRIRSRWKGCPVH